MKNWLRATTAFAGAAALTLGGAVAAVAAPSVDDGSNVKTFDVTWSDEVKRYDQDALEGSTVDLLLYCEVYEFKNGKKTGGLLDYEWTRTLTRSALMTATNIASGSTDTASSLFQLALMVA